MRGTTHKGECGAAHTILETTAGNDSLPSGAREGILVNDSLTNEARAKKTKHAQWTPSKGKQSKQAQGKPA